MEGLVARTKSYLAVLAVQTSVLLWKNVLLSRRQRRATFFQLLASFFFVLFVYGIDEAIQGYRSEETTFKNLRYPDPTDIEGIPRCEVKGDNNYCITLGYVPVGHPVVEHLIDQIISNNDPRIPESEVMGFNDADEMDAFMFENVEVVQGGIIFDKISDKRIEYTLQVNSTIMYWKGKFDDPNTLVNLPMQVAVEREAIRYFSEEAGMPDLTMDVHVKEFPHPAFQTWSTVGTIGPMFFLGAMMFGFVVQVEALVQERETGIRNYMRCMGLHDAAFWLSWLIWQFLLTFISSMFLCVFGLIFDFDFFSKNAFGLYFFLFFLFALAMTSFAFCVSCFLNKAAAATISGFAVYLVGFVAQMMVVFGYPYDCSYSSVQQNLVSLFPPSLLAKGMSDLGEATETSDEDGIAWADRDSYCTTDNEMKDCCVFGLNDIFEWLVAHFFCWFILAVYLDNVIPNEFGVTKRPLYFFRFSQWFGKSGYEDADVMRPDEVSKLTQGIELDDDVNRESVAVLSQKVGADGQTAIEMRQMQQHFFNSVLARVANSDSYVAPVAAFVLRAYAFFTRQQFNTLNAPFRAVAGTSLRIRQNELFCLLGPNGAGKTTTVNCLIGALPITHGHAFLLGEEISNNAGGLDVVRHRMGVCPQFDMLWPVLTGYEHLRLFAIIKGIPIADVEHEVAKRLEEVALTEAAHTTVNAYSGGMKRRLSVAISLIGDPKIVFLDEPTTGMDPISRRSVWKIIESMKAGRSIVLLTHSMEEADILGDRIGIMAKGRLRCLGTSLRLKNKFGIGYHVSVSPVAGNDGSEIKRFFHDKLGIVSVEDSHSELRSSSFIRFTVPRTKMDTLGDFFSALSREKRRLGVQSVQLSLTTLEDVFLSIAKQAELEEYKTIHYVAEDGTELEIPVGSDLVNIPTPTGPYIASVTWSQNEAGGLEVDSLTRVTEVATPDGRKALVPMGQAEVVVPPDAEHLTPLRMALTWDEARLNVVAAVVL